MLRLRSREPSKLSQFKSYEEPPADYTEKAWFLHTTKPKFAPLCLDIGGDETAWAVGWFTCRNVDDPRLPAGPVVFANNQQIHPPDPTGLDSPYCGKVWCLTRFAGCSDTMVMSYYRAIWEAVLCGFHEVLAHLGKGAYDRTIHDLLVLDVTRATAILSDPVVSKLATKYESFETTNHGILSIDRWSVVSADGRRTAHAVRCPIGGNLPYPTVAPDTPVAILHSEDDVQRAELVAWAHGAVLQLVEEVPTPQDLPADLTALAQWIEDGLLALERHETGAAVSRISVGYRAAGAFCGGAPAMLRRRIRTVSSPAGPASTWDLWLDPDSELVKSLMAARGCGFDTGLAMVALVRLAGDDRATLTEWRSLETYARELRSVADAKQAAADDRKRAEDLERRTRELADEADRQARKAQQKLNRMLDSVQGGMDVLSEVSRFARAPGGQLWSPYDHIGIACLVRDKGDPLIGRIVTDILRECNQGAGEIGPRQLMEGIYRKLTSQNILYGKEPLCLGPPQVVRMSENILAGAARSTACCIDLAVLVSGCISHGLHKPLIFIVEEIGNPTSMHAIPGVWLASPRQREPVYHDLGWFGLDGSAASVLVVEALGVTTNSTYRGDFEQACQRALATLRGDRWRFQYAVDIHAAWEQGMPPSRLSGNLVEPHSRQRRADAAPGQSVGRRRGGGDARSRSQRDEAL